ncbi:hypothetical protein Taro_018472 [Colocasia esculenta]|uniref:Pentatricopeptide repeat-containing protein n=1 Tax=Colocasia esculenta TaxID=4460 RepID=A0A843UTY0_COLES|nr:hypothetical protein [Colocasia esculenta]
MGLPELLEAAGFRQQQLVLSLLRSLDRPKTAKDLKRLHALVIRAGLHRSSSFVVGNLVASCASLGLMSYALFMFDQMPQPNSFVWNTLIRGLQQNRRPEDALRLFGAMRVHGAALDGFSFLNAVRTCTDLRDHRRGRCVHAQLLKSSVGFDVRLGSSLIEFYSVCDDMRGARRVFDTLPLKDAVSWTVTIAGYVNVGGDMESARDLFEEMPAKDLVAWSTMIGGYVKCGDMGTARKLFDRSPRKDLLMKNIMLGGYAKTSEINNLLQLFEEMDERDVVSWNTAITGLVGCRMIHEAMQLFHRMQLEDHRPNAVTLAGILSGCAQVGALDTGRWIHSYIDRNSYVLDSMVGTGLIDMYSKCGELESAQHVFGHMVERDVASWNAMITGLYTNGHGKQAVDLFHRMRSEGVQPNDVTMVGVLSACAHAGLVDEGRRCFDSMQRELAIVPKIEHYGCMVDLLGRAGLLHEAFEFIQHMPLPPHTGVWGALLGACKIHGNVELAEQAVERLVELDPEDGGYMAIMCNIYTDAGRWADVSRLREVMRKKGIVKMPGCSSVEIDGAIHEFGAGDKAHPRHHEIYEMVDMISLRLLTAGKENMVDDVFAIVEVFDEMPDI